MPVHDIDEPAEVIAAVGRYHLAVSGVADRVASILDALAPAVRPASPLDRALVSRLDALTRALSRSAAGQVARADASRRAAIDVVGALENADRTGAGLVRDASAD